MLETPAQSSSPLWFFRPSKCLRHLENFVIAHILAFPSLGQIPHSLLARLCTFWGKEPDMKTP